VKRIDDGPFHPGTFPVHLRDQIIQHRDNDTEHSFAVPLWNSGPRKSLFLDDGQDCKWVADETKEQLDVSRWTFSRERKDLQILVAQSLNGLFNKGQACIIVSDKGWVNREEDGTLWRAIKWRVWQPGMQNRTRPTTVLRMVKKADKPELDTTMFPLDTDPRASGMPPIPGDDDDDDFEASLESDSEIEKTKVYKSRSKRRTTGSTFIGTDISNPSTPLPFETDSPDKGSASDPIKVEDATVLVSSEMRGIDNTVQVSNRSRSESEETECTEFSIEKDPTSSAYNNDAMNNLNFHPRQARSQPQVSLIVRLRLGKSLLLTLGQPVRYAVSGTRSLERKARPASDQSNPSPDTATMTRVHFQDAAKEIVETKLFQQCDNPRKLIDRAIAAEIATTKTTLLTVQVGIAGTPHEVYVDDVDDFYKRVVAPLNELGPGVEKVIFVWLFR